MLAVNKRGRRLCQEDTGALEKWATPAHTVTTGALQSCPRVPGHSLCHLSWLDVDLIAVAKGSFRSIIAGKVPRSLGSCSVCVMGAGGRGCLHGG